jgi:hypothetical protein
MENLQQNDAAGGAGSLSQSLLGVAVNGLSRAIDGALSKKYPLTSFNENLTYNSAGQLKPASAPMKNVSATETAKGMLSSPLAIGIGVAIAGTLLILIVLKATK